MAIASDPLSMEKMGSLGPANADFVRADSHLIYKSMEPGPSKNRLYRAASNIEREAMIAFS